MNLQFQSESTQIHVLYTKFTTLYKTVLKNYIKKAVIDKVDLSKISPSNPDSFMALKDIYMGANVSLFLEQNPIDSKEYEKVRLSILSFYIELCIQIRKRFNFEDDCLKLLSKFQPQIAMSGKIPSIIEASKFFKKTVTNIEKLNNEWRLLPEISYLKSFENLPFNEFWVNVFEMKNELQEEMFPNLNKLIKAVMCLPHSSASAERIFSKLNMIKTDLRNRLSVETCNSIMLATELKDQDTCYTWQPSDDLLGRKPKRNNT